MTDIFQKIYSKPDLMSTKPTFSREAEQSVLGGLMLKYDAWDDVADIISETDFYLREHQILWRAFSELTEKNQPIDPVTLSEFLLSHNFLNQIGGGPYLAHLASNIPSAANIIAYAELVKEYALKRELWNVSIEIAESVNNPAGRTSDELVDIAEQSIYKLAKTGKKTAFIKTSDMITQMMEHLDYIAKNDGALIGLDTGFTQLNELTHGLQKSDLIIVAGTPGTGKTSFAINIAVHAIKSCVTVAIFSLEMPSNQLCNRIVSNLTGIDSQRIQNRLLDNDYPKLTKAFATLNEFGDYLQIDDSASLTIAQLRSKSRKLASQQQLGLIIVDYLQLMTSPNNENRVEEISSISRGLKSIAKELDVPIIVLSQLNRKASETTNKRPIMQHLRGSGEIEQNADMIIMLYRDDDELGDDAEINIVKHRNGPTGSFVLRFNAATTTFQNIENNNYN